jgi:transposase-like protein
MRTLTLPQNVSLAKRGRYTIEFKQEVVRLVESGQSMAEAAGSL